MMLPLHHSKVSVFNYDDIPPGYYYKVMTEGSRVQQLWHRLKFENVVGRLPISARQLLDLGCGPGSFLSIAARARPLLTCVGADVASVQIAFAKTEIQTQLPAGRVRFDELELTGAEAERLPYADASFDAVTLIEVIEHVHPFIANQMLREVRRVLKPDGRLVVTTPNYRSLWPLLEWVLEKLSPVTYHDQHINKFTPTSFVKFLETVGFKCLNVDTILVVSPFLGVISVRLARFVYFWECRIKNQFGSLLVAECRTFDASEVSQVSAK